MHPLSRRFCYAEAFTAQCAWLYSTEAVVTPQVKPPAPAAKPKQQGIPIISNPFKCLTSGADSNVEDAMEGTENELEYLVY